MGAEFPRCSEHGNERGEPKVLRSAREVVTFKALVPFINSHGFEGKEWKLICILENVIGPMQPEEGLWRAGRGGPGAMVPGQCTRRGRSSCRASG